MLAIRDVWKEYPSSAGPLPILQGVSFELGIGESAAIMGPSGCGKSTLLHIAGVLDTPSKGTVEVDGINALGLPEPEQALFRNQHIGFVFQDHCLLPQLTVFENVMTPLLVGKQDPEAAERGRELLARVGLQERMDHRPGQLSGGEKQRVAIARALVRRPGLLLCDEPTGNLDRASAQQVADLLQEIITHSRAALLVVTHSDEIARHFGKCFELRDGQLCRSGH